MLTNARSKAAANSNQKKTQDTLRDHDRPAVSCVSLVAFQILSASVDRIDSTSRRGGLR